MDLTIHRGTHEVGGSCVELCSSSGSTRIVLDIGMPLVRSDGTPFEWKDYSSLSPASLFDKGVLPRIEGLYYWQQPSLSAVLLSHAHQDHYGFLRFVHPSIPLYLSRGTRALIEVSNLFLGTSVSLNSAHNLIDGKEIHVGEFTTTPYLMDHSAPDAMALLAECDSTRLFYTGDFRGHGRKRVLLDRIEECPPNQIDCLLMEGTMLGRGEGPFPDEHAVEDELSQRFSDQKSASVVMCSGQNLDRIVSVYRATKRARRTLVVDLYGAFVLDKLRVLSKHIPQHDWPKVKVLYPNSQAAKLAAYDRSLLCKYASNKMHPDELSLYPESYVLLLRDNYYFRRSILKRLCQGRPTTVIYSMWRGYLDRGDLPAFLQRKGIELIEIHTSGHAYVQDLKRLAAALKPTMVVPIHTFHADEYATLFDNVVEISDGETRRI